MLMLYDSIYRNDNTQNYNNVSPSTQPKTNTCGYIMKVNGKGSLKIRPDMVNITIGVVTEDKQLQNAQTQNAEKMNQVIGTIKSFGIEDNQIQTVTYNISPVYDFIDGKQEFRGYRVTNIVKINVKNLERVGEIIDSAVTAGANQVGDIEFASSDPDKYYKRALMIAIKDAVEKAMVVGETLGVTVYKVPVKIIEETQGFAPVMKRVQVQALEASTPIEAGEMEISAGVEAQFIYK
jgi:uncharacterized protein